ncbi:hypothetical protein [Bradyrhizobium sp. CCBAU 65884]|uniref:hypothetical protein n=1 Tax=Bradyrhizobium sp. CCBAU 65884 TaxID=722477 RepID=UPI002304F457|nr:hypothetical protein [Bradyrhizobium sp. CCBAU 65884]
MTVWPAHIASALLDVVATTAKICTVDPENLAVADVAGAATSSASADRIHCLKSAHYKEFPFESRVSSAEERRSGNEWYIAAIEADDRLCAQRSQQPNSQADSDNLMRGSPSQAHEPRM